MISYKEVKIFYPHLSMEAPPDLMTFHHPCDVNTDIDEMHQTCGLMEQFQHEQTNSYAAIRRFSSVIHQFGLVLYQIEVKKKKKKGKKT